MPDLTPAAELRAAAERLLDGDLLPQHIALPLAGLLDGAAEQWRDDLRFERLDALAVARAINTPTEEPTP